MMDTPATLTDPTPVALYARVSSDRQDVDLSVASQLRALRDYARKNGYIVAREYVDECQSPGSIGQSSPGSLSHPVGL